MRQRKIDVEGFTYVLPKGTRIQRIVMKKCPEWEIFTTTKEAYYTEDDIICKECEAKSLSTTRLCWIIRIPVERCPEIVVDPKDLLIPSEFPSTKPKRKLKVKWTVESMDDYKRMHGMK
jgi:hypothetical protein